MAETAAARVRILGLRVSKRAEDGNALSGMVASFDAKIPGLTLFGATLWRRRDGQMTASPPRGERNDGSSSGVRIDDEELKAELCAAACRVAAIFGANVDPVEPPATAFSELAGALKDRSASDREA
ncbi:hypothetical protein Q8W71_06835 [Methylobacterium sp. NEAU 140]|uniref:hypothetical protein n=1 Tax=Methylobacterium sp. NEAU 140 TaxID=3064945 RepID=UPI00273684FA|nr:hypothetical protein [Methylobacterium sp. NEAU 140]MDP4022332.1 hypothetical protein [Methylobacterium sp. NEAU 140]